MLGWLVNERAIEPHIPVFEKSAHLERILRHDRLRPRGPSGAQDGSSSLPKSRTSESSGG